MTTQKTKKDNKNLKNITKAAYIKYQLQLRGYTQKMVADELNINKAAVCQVISGVGKSRRVSKWLEENLGVEYES